MLAADEINHTTCVSWLKSYSTELLQHTLIYSWEFSAKFFANLNKNIDHLVRYHIYYTVYPKYHIGSIRTVKRVPKDLMLRASVSFFNPLLAEYEDLPAGAGNALIL